jgi:DNA-binding LytR/AlgR family response regulator
MENKINCIIADDEYLAQQGLVKFAAEIPFLNVAGVCANAFEVMAELDRRQVDLLFLDIQMPGMTGLELVKTIRKLPLTVLATAYPDFALEGYELDIVDYLVKPISFSRFLKSVTKAKELLELQNGNSDKKQKYFFIKCDNCLEKIDYVDVLFIQGMRNHVIIYTTRRRYVCYVTLKNVEAYLPPETFLKVNKSNVISIDHIDKIVGADIIIGDHEITISKANKSEIIERLFANNVLSRK